MRAKGGVALMIILLSQSTAISAAPKRERDSSYLKTAKIIDLTYSFDEKTLYWPTAPSKFELKKLSYGETPGGYFYAANSFCTPEHGGTHLDAPIHFAQGAASADQIPVRQLIAPAVVIDIRPKAERDPDYRLSIEDVNSWERRNGAIASGTIVLLRTGWGKRWPDAKRYLGDDTQGDASKLHFPSYGDEAATYLVNQRHVAALGVDTASIDYGASKGFNVHRISSAAGVPGLENVANLDQLPESGAWVIALPMKIAGGTGGPLRIVALLP